jgi:hypothetical protein
MAGILFMMLTYSCSSGSQDIDDSVNDAEQAYTNGDIDGARKICSYLMTNDFDKLSEPQLGKLAIILMKLSETDNTDDNVADATVCFRQARKLSTDSMRGFYNTLQPEDIPQFVMLTRISGSIDFPPDLSEETFSEDSLQVQLAEQP